jgi:hypothetical protein
MRRLRAAATVANPADVYIVRETVEALRWDGTFHGVTRVLDFAASHGQSVGDKSYDTDFWYEQESISNQSTLPMHVCFKSDSGYSAVMPGEWLVWSPRSGFFSLTDEDADNYFEDPQMVAFGDELIDREVAR